MPLPLLAQHDTKLAHLARALELRRLSTDPLALSASPRALGYRNRIRLRIESPGVIRFFNQYKQPSCAVLEPKLRERLTTLLQLSREKPGLFAPFLHLELRSDDDLGRPGLVLAGAPPDLQALLAPATELASVLDTHLVGLRGDPDIACQKRRIVDEVSAFVPLDAFWQVNSEVNALLVASLRAGARERGLRTMLDLYAGAGNFAIPLAAAGIASCAVEIHGPAVRALRAAAAAQGLECEGYAEPALLACQRFSNEGRRFELVLIDAPRAGARDVVRSAALLSSRSVVVCSCNPDTLARDLAELQVSGFRLEELRAFDMFPHTRHLEALAWLTRC